MNLVPTSSMTSAEATAGPGLTAVRPSGSAETVELVRSRAASAVHTPELDGLRAIAVWMVMLMHGFVAFPDYQNGILPRWLSPLQFGWLGVDLFFVLSGFLISGILLDSRDKPRYLRNFYGRRVLRIMPLYFVFVAVTSWFYSDYGTYFLAATGFMANYAPALGIPTPHGPSVLWSLAIEEQFYLLWPLVILLAGRTRLLWIAGGIVLITPVLRWVWRANGGDGLDTYLFSWFRFDGLALGSFLAAWIRLPCTTVLRSVGLAAGLVLLSLTVTALALPYGVFVTNSVASGALRFTQVYLVFGAALLMAFTFRGTVFTVPLRSRAARLSAELSFCLYLVHVCVLDLWWWIENELALRPVSASYAEWAIVRTAVVILASFGLALLSRRFIEAPCLRLKRYFA